MAPKPKQSKKEQRRLEIEEALTLQAAAADREIRRREVEARLVAQAQAEDAALREERARLAAIEKARRKAEAERREAARQARRLEIEASLVREAAAEDEELSARLEAIRAAQEATDRAALAPALADEATLELRALLSAHWARIHKIFSCWGEATAASTQFRCALDILRIAAGQEELERLLKTVAQPGAHGRVELRLLDLLLRRGGFSEGAGGRENNAALALASRHPPVRPAPMPPRSPVRPAAAPAYRAAPVARRPRAAKPAVPQPAMETMRNSLRYSAGGYWPPTGPAGKSRAQKAAWMREADADASLGSPRLPHHAPPSLGVTYYATGGIRPTRKPMLGSPSRPQSASASSLASQQRSMMQLLEAAEEIYVRPNERCGPTSASASAFLRPQSASAARLYRHPPAHSASNGALNRPQSASTVHVSPKPRSGLSRPQSAAALLGPGTWMLQRELSPMLRREVDRIVFGAA